MKITSNHHLRKEVAHELVVVGHNFPLEVHTLLAADDADELARNSATLPEERGSAMWATNPWHLGIYCQNYFYCQN